MNINSFGAKPYFPPVEPELPATANGGNPTASSEKMKEAVESMESLFITQMYQAMRRTAPGSTLFGNTRNEEMFRDMLDQEMAKEAAHSGAFGLGKSLYQQFAAPAENGPEGKPAPHPAARPR